MNSGWGGAEKNGYSNMNIFDKNSHANRRGYFKYTELNNKIYRIPATSSNASAAITSSGFVASIIPTLSFGNFASSLR